MSNLENVLASRQERLIDYMVVLGPQVEDNSFARDISRARSDSTSIDPIYDLYVLEKDDVVQDDWIEVQTVGQHCVDINTGQWNPSRRQFYNRNPRISGASVPVTAVHIHNNLSKEPVQSCWRQVNSKPYGRHDTIIYVEHNPDGAPLLDLIILDPSKNDLIPQSYTCCDGSLNTNVGGKRYKLGYRVKSDAKADNSSSSFRASLLARYPTADLPGNPLDSSGLSHLCFPSGISISSAMQLPTFLTFVSTKMDGSEVYGAALTCYDRLPASVCICNDAEFSDSCPKHAHDPHARRMSQLRHTTSAVRNQPLFVSHCLCLISRWPFLTPFKALLEQLYRVSLNYRIEPFILRLLLHTRLPKPSLSHFVLPVGHAKITFTLPPRMSLPKLAPNSGLSLMEIFTCLSVPNIITVWRHLLVEGRVLLTSNNHTLLAPVAEAFRSLLSPLQWQCMFIPILPLSMASVVRAPFPFLVGVHRGFLDQVRISSDILLVDLDSNKLRFPQPLDQSQASSSNLVLSDTPLELKHGAKIGSFRYNPPYHPQIPSLIFTQHCRRNSASIHAPSLPEDLYTRLEKKLHQLLPLFGKRNDSATSSHSYIPENDFSSYVDADFYEDLLPLMPSSAPREQDPINAGIAVGAAANPMYRKDIAPNDTVSRLLLPHKTAPVEVPKSQYCDLDDSGGLLLHRGKMAVVPPKNPYLYTNSSLDAMRNQAALPTFVLLQVSPSTSVERTLYGDGVETSYASGLSCAQFREACVRLEFFDVFCSLVGKHTQRHTVQTTCRAVDWRVDAAVNSGLYMPSDQTPYATYLQRRLKSKPTVLPDVDRLVSPKLSSGNQDMQSLLLPSPSNQSDKKVDLVETLQGTQFFAEWINSYLYPSIEVPLPLVLPANPRVRAISSLQNIATNARHTKRASISSIDVSSLTSSAAVPDGAEGIVRGEFSHEKYNTGLGSPFSFHPTHKEAVGLTTTTISSAYHKSLLMNILYEMNHGQHYPFLPSKKNESGLAYVLANVHVVNNNMCWAPYNSLATPRFSELRQSSTATAASVFLRTGQWGLTLQSQSFFAGLAKKHRANVLKLVDKADDYCRNSHHDNNARKDLLPSPLFHGKQLPVEATLCPWSIIRLLQWPSVQFGQDAPTNTNKELLWVNTSNKITQSELSPEMQLLVSMDCSAMTCDVLLVLLQRLFRKNPSVSSWAADAQRVSSSDVQYQWLGRFGPNSADSTRSSQITTLQFQQENIEQLYDDSLSTPSADVHGWSHVLPMTLGNKKAQVDTEPLATAVDAILKEVPVELGKHHRDLQCMDSDSSDSEGYYSEEELEFPTMHSVHRPCAEVLALHSYGESVAVLADALAAPLALLGESLTTPALAQLRESQLADTSAIQREFAASTGGDVLVHGLVKNAGWGLSADVAFMDACKAPTDAAALDATVGQEVPCILDQIASSPISPQNAYTNACAPALRSPAAPAAPLALSADTSITVPTDFQSISPPHTAPLSLTPTSPLSWLMTSMVTSSVHDLWTFLYVSRPSGPLAIVQQAMSYHNSPCTTACLDNSGCSGHGSSSSTSSTSSSSSTQKTSLFNIQNSTKSHHSTQDVTNTQHIVASLTHLAVSEMKHSEQQVLARIEKHLNNSANCAAFCGLLEKGFFGKLKTGRGKVSSLDLLQKVLPSVDPINANEYCSRFPSVGSVVTQIRLAAERDLLVLLTQLTHQITRRCVPLASTLVTILQALQILGMESAAASVKALLQNHCVDFSWHADRAEESTSDLSNRSLRFAEKSVSHKLSSEKAVLSSPMPVPLSARPAPVWSGLTIRRSIGLTGLVSLAGAAAGYANINSTTIDMAKCALANHLSKDTSANNSSNSTPVVTPSVCLPWPVQCFTTASCPKCKLELSTSEVLASYSQHLQRQVSMSSGAPNVNPFVDDAIECWRCASHLLPKVTVVFDGSPCAREYCESYYRSSPFAVHHSADSDSDSDSDTDDSKVATAPLYITQPLISPMRIRSEIDNLLLSHTYSPDAFVYEGANVGSENIFSSAQNLHDLSAILRYNSHVLFDELPDTETKSMIGDEDSMPFAKPSPAQSLPPSPLSIVRAHPSLLWSCFFLFALRDAHHSPQTGTLPASSLNGFLPGCNTPGTTSIPAADPITSDILGGKTSLLAPNVVTSVELLLSDAPLNSASALDLPALYKSTSPVKLNSLPTYVITQPSGGTWVIYRDGYVSCPCHKDTQLQSDDEEDSEDEARYIDPLRVNLPVSENEQLKYWKCRCHDVAPGGCEGTTNNDATPAVTNTPASPGTAIRREARNTICNALFPHLRMITNPTPLAHGLGNSGSYRIAEYLRTTSGDGSLNVPCRIALIARLSRNTIHMLSSSQKKQKIDSTCTCVEELIESFPRTHTLYSKRELQALQSYHLYFHPLHTNLRSTVSNPYHGCPNPAVAIHDFSHFTSKSSLMNTLRLLDAPVAMPPSYPGEAASENTVKVPLVLRAPLLPKFIPAESAAVTGSPLCYTDLMNSPRPRPFFRFLHSYAKTMQWLRLQSSSAALTAAMKPSAPMNKNASITGGTMTGLFLYPALSSPAMRSNQKATTPTPVEYSASTSGSGVLEFAETSPVPLLASHAEIALHSASKTPMHKLAREIQAHDFMFSACLLSFVGAAESLWTSVDLQSGCNNGVGIWTLSNSNHHGKHLFWSAVPIMEELEVKTLPACCERADDEKELALFKQVLGDNLGLFTSRDVSFNAVNTRLFAVLLAAQKLTEDLDHFSATIDLVNSNTPIANKNALLDVPAGATDLAAKLVALSQKQNKDAMSIVEDFFVTARNGARTRATPPLFPLLNSNPQIGRGTNTIASIEDMRGELQKRKKKEAALESELTSPVNGGTNLNNTTTVAAAASSGCEIELGNLRIGEDEHEYSEENDETTEPPTTLSPEERLRRVLQVKLPVEPKLEALLTGFFLLTPDAPTLRLLRRQAYFTSIAAGYGADPSIFAACSWDSVADTHAGTRLSPLSLLLFFQVMVKGLRDLMGPGVRSELKPRSWEIQTPIDPNGVYPLCSLLGLKTVFPFHVNNSAVIGSLLKKERAIAFLCQCAAELVRAYVQQPLTPEPAASFITVKLLQLPAQLDVYLQDFDSFASHYREAKENNAPVPWDDILGTSMLLGEIAFNWMKDAVQSWIQTCFKTSSTISESSQPKAEGGSITNIMRARARAGSRLSHLYSSSPSQGVVNYEPGALRLEDLHFEDSDMDMPVNGHRRVSSNNGPAYTPKRRLTQSVGIYKAAEDRAKDDSTKKH